MADIMPRDPTDRFADWPQEVRESLAAGEWNGCVGTTLVSETDQVRVWILNIPPGERFGFHRHVLTYFWTCLSNGRSRNYFADGRIGDRELRWGQTMHISFGPGEFMVHSVLNTGDTPINFVTVEFLTGPNASLPIPDHVRLPVPAV